MSSQGQMNRSKKNLKNQAVSSKNATAYMQKQYLFDNRTNKKLASGELGKIYQSK